MHSAVFIAYIHSSWFSSKGAYKYGRLIIFLHSIVSSLESSGLSPADLQLSPNVPYFSSPLDFTENCPEFCFHPFFKLNTTENTYSLKVMFFLMG